ncbi:MAG TPA: EAL domain-containing protein, partial [Candidatus Saccharimonadales bacterium]|nr:EAL domain-containing protein [Candidatus Saccharimonadales bacterium]
ALFGNSVERLGAARSLIQIVILVAILLAIRKHNDRHLWAGLVISGLLLLGIMRELLSASIPFTHFAGAVFHFPWLNPVTSFIIDVCASTIALVFLTLSGLAMEMEETRVNSERMQQLINAADHGICEVNQSGLISFVNAAASAMMEIDREDLSKVWIQEKLQACEDDHSIRAVSEFVLRPTATFNQMRARILRWNRLPLPVEWSSSPILRNGKPAGAAVTLHDVSEHDAADRFHRYRTELLELIARNKPVEEVAKILVSAVEERLPGFSCSILVCDIESFRVIASPKLPEGFHLAMNTMPCDRIFQVTDRKGSQELNDWEDALRKIAADFNFAGTWSEPMISSANELLGTVVLNHSVMAPLDPLQSSTLGEAARLGSLAVEHRMGYERLLHQGYHDALTGLPNRLLLADRVKQALARAERNHTQVAYLSIDLDRFKDINDTLGHDAGDLFLKQISVRMQARVRASDTFARTGGDEFTLILPDMHDVRDSIRVAENLTAALRDPFKVENHTIYGTASIGIAVYPQDGRDIDTLQRNADRAMYRAKAQGRNFFQSYSDHDSQEDRNRIEIEFHLRRAIEQGGFSLNFQPQFTCDHRLVAFEALLRFQHPKLGMVPPSRFIPMAEESGLILPIGEWVLHEVCRQIAEWQDKGLRGIRVAINVSPLQLARGDFADTVARALQASGVKPDLLELELTEGVLMTSVRDSAQQIAAMARTGVRLSVDDFGTGYSCLSYLHQLPLHVLKIDRSFVARMLEPDGTRCIVEAIISLAHRLGLQTVAEGVENEVQLEFLRTLGCDLIQGFFFSKPLSAIDASCLLWQDTVLTHDPARDLPLSQPNRILLRHNLSPTSGKPS